jgi:hypothetical protein
MILSPVIFYILVLGAGLAVGAAVYLYFLLREQKKILEIITLFNRWGEHGPGHDFSGELLSFLRAKTETDTACILFEADAVTAEVVDALPENPFSGPYLSPEVYAEAVAKQRCVFIPNYAGYEKASYILSSLSTASAVFIPFQYTENRSGAILLLWKKPRNFSPAFRVYIEQVR